MIPIIDKTICTDCQLCVKDCIANAISEERKNINEDRCILCVHCVAICPVEAISINGTSVNDIPKQTEEMPRLLESLIKGRRSVRNYIDKPVSRDEIEKIVNTANYSPTGTNSRMVGITVLDSREKINELSDIIMRHFKTVTRLVLNPVTLPILYIILGRTKTRKLFSYKKLIAKYWSSDNILTHNAHLLMIFHASQKSSTPSQDGVIWSTTAMYYAESMGLGTCFNGFLVIGINTCKKARKFIGLEKGHKVHETFTAGYPQFFYKRSVEKNDLNVNFV